MKVMEEKDGIGRGKMPHPRKWGCWLAAAMVALAMAGCGGSETSSRRDAPAASKPRTPPRPPTPEEAMELDLATPLSAAAEHWIVDTDVGDAWAQAKENVADLRARLVADWKSRQESRVGDTPASMAMRREYDRWLGIHERLKAFIVDCQARGKLRGMPPELARNFKDWGKLRRELLRDAPETLDALEADFAAMREEYAGGRSSGGTDAERLAAAEELGGRFAARRAEAEGFFAGAEELGRHYATDDAVADIAERAGEVAADAKRLGSKIEGLRAELRDAETVRVFETRVTAFVAGTHQLGERMAEQARREAEARTLSQGIADDIQARNFARTGQWRTRLEALKAESVAARGEDTACARAVKAVAKDFAGTLGNKAIRALRHELASEAPAARIETLSKEAEAAAARHGKTLDSALVSLQNASFKLEDGAGERAALTEAEKRMARLEALAKRGGF